MLAKDLQVPWDKPAPWACGGTVSLYDVSMAGGKCVRSGDPIADCFAVLAYAEGALLVVADGVNWGEPARRAACCAVVGATRHMHSVLESMQGAPKPPACATVFHELAAAMRAAQALIIERHGTLTTLVMTLVLKLHRPRSRGGGGSWGAFTLTVGDSAAYVLRARTGAVQELTYAAHEGCARNPAWAPGSLGYAIGEEPDLGNMTATFTRLSEGDIVFLASDGVTDNFDPGVLHLAKASPAPGFEGSSKGGSLRNGSPDSPQGAQQQQQVVPPKLPTLDPAQMHARAMQLMQEAIAAIAAGVPGGSVSLQRKASAVSSLSGPNDPTAAELEAACVRASAYSEHSAAAYGGGRSSAVAAAEASRTGGEGLTARKLVDGLLHHVHRVTEPQRLHVSAVAAAATSPKPSPFASMAGQPSQPRGYRRTLPPGKMDHATVVAYTVGSAE